MRLAPFPVASPSVGTLEARPGGAVAARRLFPLCLEPSATAASCLPRVQRAYQAVGGLVTGDALCALMREHCDQPISLLARWIVDRQVVSFDVGGQRWLPMFQFDAHTLEVQPGVSQVIQELTGVFDDVELAEWFATPNSWLNGASPASMLPADAAKVLHAARADHFVAVG